MDYHTEVLVAVKAFTPDIWIGRRMQQQIIPEGILHPDTNIHPAMLLCNLF